MSGEGGGPPGESVAGLGDFQFLAVDVVFDFGNGWEDVLFGSVCVDDDPGVGVVCGIVRFEVYDQTGNAVSDSFEAGQLTECVLVSLGE